MTNTNLMTVIIKRYMDKWYPYLVINQTVNTIAVEVVALKFLEKPTDTPY